MATYNGHESWAAWNVALWIGNNEGLYRLAKELKRRHGSARKAAAELFDTLTETGCGATPDGAKYSRHNLELAIRGF